VSANSKPKISVVMPCHNGMPYLPEALHSVLHQDFADFELLVIDDASDDATPEILRAVSDSRLRVIRHDRKQGVAQSLNDGLDQACGRYIARLDADDAALSYRFRLQIEHLDSHPETALVASSVRYIDAKGDFLYQPAPFRDGLKVRERLLLGNCLHHSSVMFRRSWQDSSLRYPLVYLVEDYQLWLSLAEKAELDFLEIPCTDHRIHQDQITAGPMPRHRELGETLRRRTIEAIQLESPEEADRVLRAWLAKRDDEFLFAKAEQALQASPTPYAFAHADRWLEDLIRENRRHPCHLRQGVLNRLGKARPTLLAAAYGRMAAEALYWKIDPIGQARMARRQMRGEV